MKAINIGIIGGGLMGREMASAFARWCALENMPVEPRLVAVADPSEKAREWFRRLPSVTTLVATHQELLAKPGCGCGLCRGAASLA
jgi:predicted dehydrogenase